MRLGLWLALCSSFAGDRLQAQDTDAVVAVYAIHGDRRSSQGTGFFVDTSGTILTAYHVIAGAKDIVVVNSGRFWYDVDLEAVRPDRDLARLVIRDKDLRKPTPFIPLDMHANDTAGMRSLQVIGWPRGLPTSVLPGNRTQRGFLPSKTIRRASGKSLFAVAIPLLMVNVTTYNGMSGAPIILPSGAIGVLSGSLTEGGAIAWAIPIAESAAMSPFAYDPKDVGKWPDFPLIDGPWEQLRSDYSYHPFDRETFDLFFRTMDHATQVTALTASLCGKLTRVADRMRQLRPVMIRVFGGAAATQKEIEDVRTFFDLAGGYDKNCTDTWNISMEAVSNVFETTVLVAKQHLIQLYADSNWKSDSATSARSDSLTDFGSERIRFALTIGMTQDSAIMDQSIIRRRQARMAMDSAPPGSAEQERAATEWIDGVIESFEITKKSFGDRSFIQHQELLRGLNAIGTAYELLVFREDED